MAVDAGDVIYSILGLCFIVYLFIMGGIYFGEKTGWGFWPGLGITISIPVVFFGAIILWSKIGSK